MSIHNVCFCGEIRKILCSSPSYQKLCGNIANSEQSSHTPAIATRGMLNHNFVDANFLVYCMREMGKTEKKKSHHLGFLLHDILHHCQGVYKI